MITVSVEQTRGATTVPMRVSAPSIERALVLAGDDQPGTSVKVLFPIDAEAFFAPVAREGIQHETATAEGTDDEAHEAAETRAEADSMFDELLCAALRGARGRTGAGGALPEPGRQNAPLRR